MSTSFSCVLVGDESLLITCGETLRDRGHTIRAVVSEDESIRDWARNCGATVCANFSALTDAFSAGSVDWLFSIANLKLLKPDVLEVAAKGAINFHDGPLPRYAGLNAPVWALLAREREFAVTWHLIEARVDEGDILVQTPVTIDAGETAFSLNAKCYGAAADSFGTVVSQIETGTLNRQTQDLAQRSYFGRHHRPPAGAMIDPAASGGAIARQVSALDFGGYWNPLTVARIDLGGGRIAAVRNAQAATVTGAMVPGTVLERSADSIVIATQTHPVRLGGLCTLDGHEITLPEPGTVLPNLDDARITALEETSRQTAKSDDIARRAFKDFAPARLPLAATSDGLAANWHAIPLAASETLEKVAVAALGLALISCEKDDGVHIAVSHAGDPTLCMEWLPLTKTTDSIAEILQSTQKTLTERATLGPVSRDIALRIPGLAPLATPDIAVSLSDTPVSGAAVCLCLKDNTVQFTYDAARISEQAAQLLADRFITILGKFETTKTLADLPRLSGKERTTVLRTWNDTATAYDTLTMHDAFAKQVERTPDAVALIHEDNRITYAELALQARAMAARLQAEGVTRGDRVGLHLRRGPEMVASALGILMAGAAYVPLDPDYPADRITHYVSDSQAGVVLTHSSIVHQCPAGAAKVVVVDEDTESVTSPYFDPGAEPDDLAYLIYTSGSTGTPKGVMVEHRNVANFFAGMDARLAPDTGGVWMAVTSLAFDISVLELFYTLARGYTVVLAGDGPRAAVSGGPIRLPEQQIDFNLYYWGNDGGVGRDKYALLLDGARFADEHGFNAVWTPERHFHAFGGPYPNPSVTGAAVAAVTRNLSVRAGSCVAPLHHTARIAEEWSVIDNLTNGRAGLAIASGWQPDDFVLRPENTPPNNKPAMYQSISDLRKLWRGETVAFPTKDGGRFDVLTQPRPVSKELPIWVTTAGNPDTWREAGEIGANVLTHLLGQTIEEVEGKIRIYHDALRAAGHNPVDFEVSIMLHTFLAQDRETARAVAREPMKSYLRSAAGLIKQYAWAFPAFKRPEGVNNPFEMDLRDLDAETLEAILDFAFERYFEDAGLFGTIEDGLARAEQLRRIGVTEIACLIDYGIEHDTVMEGLKPLAEVLRRAKEPVSLEPDDFSIAAQIVRHGVTHLQCTPSMARILTMVDESRIALSRIQTLMLGGEALPADLVADLGRATQARILNMYGPTETTIWSTSAAVSHSDRNSGTLEIGTPIANTSVYVVTEENDLAPVGVSGELCIGGHGVTRGYWQREALTAERFPLDPFASETGISPLDPEPHLYRTGDLARWLPDGTLDFLGRLDHQVKIRGQRIELGEIETAMAAFSGVDQAVVKPHEDALAGYVTGSGPIDTKALRTHLAGILPEAMVPSHIVQIPTIPLTPNKKIDRKALPDPIALENIEQTPASTPNVAETPVATEIAAIWSRVLGVSKINPQDNFFNLGGHSLLAVQAHREIRKALGLDNLSITDIFRFPTLSGLAAHISSQSGLGDDTPPAGNDTTAPSIDRSDTISKRRAMRAQRARKG